MKQLKSEQFRHTLKIWWDNWKIEKNKYSDVREWWDHTECQVMLQKLTWPFINNLGRWEQQKKINKNQRD